MREAREVLDDMLVLSSQAGDTRALELLARRWQPRLLRHAYRLTGNRDAAADTAQEAWIGIVRGLRGLRDPAQFGSWALRIVQNKSRDWIRKETRRREATSQLKVSWPTDEAANPTSADADVTRLRETMTELSDEQRAILRLFYTEDRKVGEISNIMGIPPGTVKSRLFYARRTLRKSLDGTRDHIEENKNEDA